MGRKGKLLSKEARKSMKELTKGHEEFMASRNQGRQEEKEDGKGAFDELLEKAAKTKHKTRKVKSRQ